MESAKLPNNTGSPTVKVCSSIALIVIGVILVIATMTTTMIVVAIIEAVLVAPKSLARKGAAYTNHKRPNLKGFKTLKPRFFF